jgi:hypothetical protein
MSLHHGRLAASNAWKAAAVTAMRIMPTDVHIPGVGAFYDCAALLGGRGHWPDIVISRFLIISRILLCFLAI